MKDATTAPATEQLAVDFREAMGNLATGVVMVTTEVDGRPWGLTVSACCSISMAPPTIAVSLIDTTVSAKVIAEAGRFGVSILGEELIEAARFGAARGAPKFIEHLCSDQEAYVSPVVESAIAHIDCRVGHLTHVADHVVFFGEVERVLRHPVGDNPLVYHDRHFHRLSQASDIHAAPAPNLWW